MQFEPYWDATFSAIVQLVIHMWMQMSSYKVKLKVGISFDLRALRKLLFPIL